METIARNGSAAIYQGGSVGQNLVKDLGGHITLDDLSEYEVKETKPNMTTGANCPQLPKQTEYLQSTGDKLY